MCGICGIVGEPSSEILIRKMMGLMVHRGPDEGGVFLGNAIGLGHRRLSIVDLAGGRQPVFNEDRSQVLIYNGEIYNHQELRGKLEKQGHVFQSAADTEVVIHAFEQQGVGCLDTFNGMFSFAIWNKYTQEIFLARDRLGVKPLYYAVKDNCLVFSSELKSILACPWIDRELNLAAVEEYLALRYVPHPHTLLKGIFKLPAGHYLTYSKAQGLKINRYWHLEPESSVFGRSEESYLEEFTALLDDAVKIRLMSDVPFGAYLSGGLDSSTIVSLMARHMNQPVKTFSVGFGVGNDELDDAAKFARSLGANHQQIIVQPDDFDLIPEVVWYLDEPVGDAIVLPLFLLSRLASQTVKMVLTGEGADELLGGYFHQESLLKIHKIRQFPFSPLICGLGRKILKLCPPSILDHFFNYPADLGKEGKNRLIDLLGVLQDPLSTYMYFVSLFVPNEIDNVLLRKDKDKGQFQTIVSQLLNERNPKYFEKLLAIDYRFWLPDNILTKQDKLSMAHSVEARVPFLDYRLVEFSSKLPLNLKLSEKHNKAILRQSAKDILPSGLAKRKKQAFNVPLETAFQYKVKELVSGYLGEESVRKRGLYNPTYINELRNRLQDGEFLAYKKIMSLTILEIWFRKFIDIPTGQGINVDGKY